jgi:hypothetical protein
MLPGDGRFAKPSSQAALALLDVHLQASDAQHNA